MSKLFRPDAAVALLILPLAAFFVSGCGGSGSPGSSGPALSSRWIMPVDRVPAASRRRGTILMSVQAAKDGEISAPGFVNGAIPLDEVALKVFSESAGAFTNFDGWASLFGALGVTPDSEVILYDDGEMKFASRVRFLLFYFGVRRAFIVDGGYNAMLPLIADGRLTQTPPATPAQSVFQVKIQDSPIHLVGRDDVRTALGNPGVTLLDVRTVQEYDGCVVIPPVPPSRGGHIPGARNLPVENLLTPQASNPDFSFLDGPFELRKIFRDFGLHTHDRVFAYCHDGAKSSLAAVSLINAGYDNVSLYYLSYLDWQSDPSDPIETVSPCG